MPCISTYTGITIGLTNTTFVVTEGDGAFVEVCAQVFDGQLERNAIVTLQTMDGSAVSQGTEPDYQSLTVQLTFMPSMLEICRNVIIINDVFYEDPEQLTVGLTTDDVFVDLMPDEGTITILDEEGWYCTIHIAAPSDHDLFACSNYYWVCSAFLFHP